MYIHFRKFALLLVSLPLMVTLSLPRVGFADISQNVRQGDSEQGTFFELGLGLIHSKIPIVAFLDDTSADPNEGIFALSLLINGRADWRGFFIEAFYESFTGAALGYKLWQGENSSLDFLLTSEFDDYDPGIGDFESLKEREGDALAGFRGVRYFGNTVAQMEVYGDISDTHNGGIVALQIGRFGQVRNWNLHAMVGARYYSDRVLNHYLGISTEESSAGVPAYKASGGTLGTLEFGATVPLNEKWIFRTTAKVHYLSDAITDSPLSDGHIGTELSSTFSYVF